MKRRGLLKHLDDATVASPLRVWTARADEVIE
jgi:hypothetical protein